MIFVPNPILGQLTLNDLSQRYEGSYIEYNNEPKYVRGFVQLASGINIVLEDIVHGEFVEKNKTTSKFRHELLNTAKPDAGWYLYQDSRNKRSVPILLSYSTDRQWKRGLHGNNTFYWSPITPLIGLGAVSWAALTDAGEMPMRVPLDLLTNASIVPRRDRCFVYFKEAAAIGADRFYWDFYLRGKLIGQLLLNEKKFRLFHDGFLQEFEECLYPRDFATLEIVRDRLPSPKEPDQNPVKVAIQKDLGQMLRDQMGIEEFDPVEEEDLGFDGDPAFVYFEEDGRLRLQGAIAKFWATTASHYLGAWLPFEDNENGYVLKDLGVFVSLGGPEEGAAKTTKKVTLALANHRQEKVMFAAEAEGDAIRLYEESLVPGVSKDFYLWSFYETVHRFFIVMSPRHGGPHE